MKWPSISIIIPSFNQGRFIERTLLSIFKQDYPGDVQVIVSDGGSSDETTEILRKYPEITWWSKGDEGLVDAINQGFSAATGDVLAIQSSDDFYLPDAFVRSITELVQDSSLALVSGCDVYLMGDGKSFSCSALDDHNITPRSLMMRRVIPQHCAFFWRSMLKITGGLGPEISEGAEIDLWYRALHFVEARFIPHHTAVYQFHDQQRTVKGDRWYQSLTQIVESCEADEKFASRFRFDALDKQVLYQRWLLQEARRSGNEARVAVLLDELSRGASDETITFLIRQGFLPKSATANPRHPNHRVPDIHWSEPKRDTTDRRAA
ncbi:MAG: glycosyltransferase [Phycisphaerae bacterium]|nr:glycosyltransferase [Phycisphaerae bacterium]